MKKSKGIELLKIQIEKIKDESLNRKEWIASTKAILMRIFPISYALKFAQIENLEGSPEYFDEISPGKRIEARKNKAERYLLNYIEEIELLGVENQYNKLEMFFGSFRFWGILVAICIISFIGGHSYATQSFNSTNNSLTNEKTRLQQENDLQRNQIQTLQQQIQELRMFSL